ATAVTSDAATVRMSGHTNLATLPPMTAPLPRPSRFDAACAARPRRAARSSRVSWSLGVISIGTLRPCVFGESSVIPVVTPEEIRAIDAAATEPVEILIDRAGAAVARAAIDMLGGTYGRRVVVIAGRGNNGADGRAAARRLARRGVRISVLDAA